MHNVAAVEKAKAVKKLPHELACAGLAKRPATLQKLVKVPVWAVLEHQIDSLGILVLSKKTKHVAVALARDRRVDIYLPFHAAELFFVEPPDFNYFEGHARASGSVARPVDRSEAAFAQQ